MDCYTIAQEPRGEIHRSFLQVAMSYCQFASLVIRAEDRPTSECQRTLALLRPYLQFEDRRMEWPGTKLLAGPGAHYFQYLYNSTFVESAATLVQGLYDWILPDRPEDLCLYRADGSVWLGSIAHERDAFLNLTPEEFARLQNELPFLPDGPDAPIE